LCNKFNPAEEFTSWVCVLTHADGFIYAHTCFNKSNQNCLWLAVVNMIPIIVVVNSTRSSASYSGSGDDGD
jgi:hypothetical protein